MNVIVVLACVSAVVACGLIIFRSKYKTAGVPHSNRHVWLIATIVQRNVYHNAVGNYDYEAICEDAENRQQSFKISKGMYEYLKEGQQYSMICDGESIYHIDGYSQSTWQQRNHPN